jgi:adhesin transport system outer membrane protein
MKRSFLSLSLLTLACTATMAQNSALSSAARRAIETSPDVSAKLNALRAAMNDVEVASGALRPKLDLSADIGHNTDTVTGRTGNDTASMNRNGVALTATQLLWDGFVSSSEVGRTRHAKLARYFEFADATEQAALEAGRALYDVQRYRTLVALAEQNYVQHKYAFEQIQSRVKAGVARGVDQEQSAARLALAESNLVTERANLHDVTERYRRVVGELPPAGTLGAGVRSLPASASAAMEATALNSPVIASAIESLRATKAQAEARKGSYQPRIEARLRAGMGTNFDGVENQKRDMLGQIVLNWNIFNGGIDDARQRQTANLLNQAQDLRDKACRDTRQTTAIAYNDVQKLSEQLGYLERNVAAIEKARDAYRQQFDIGQRSLLDLLNAENEVYTARRSLAVAQADLEIAKLRTQASIGTLVEQLGLSREDTRALAQGDERWSAGDDAAGRCPLSPTQVAGASRAELDARAAAMMTPAAAPVAAPAAVAPVALPVAAAPASGFAEQRLRDWAAAWSAKDLNRYYGFYGEAFPAGKAKRAAWMAQRKKALGKPGEISVELSDVQTREVSPTRVETTFRQSYRSSGYSDQMVKTLTWERAGADWVIVGESNR